MLGSLLRRLFSPRAAPSAPAPVEQAYASMKQGKAAEAVAFFEAALAANPPTPGLLNDLGLCLVQLLRYVDAERVLQQALQLDPACTPARVNLGNLYLRMNDPESAEAMYRHALQEVPADALLWSHLAMSLCNSGRADESLECSRHALQLSPEDEVVRSNLIFALVLAPAATARDLLEETRRWSAQRAEALTAAAAAHTNLPDPERPLRIGYLSADLRAHPVASFVEPLLAHHDPALFFVHCYSNSSAEDAQSARLRSLAHAWTNVASLSDEELAALVRRDGIDLLVDLAGHTYGNRLLAMARRPAPVQLTDLGFPASTGMSAMDYRITDAQLDPPGDGDAFYLETQLRLPDSLWCFRPLGTFAEPVPTPALACGYVTFGSFNGFHKIHQDLLEDWARLLQNVAASRMVIITVPEGKTRARITATFAAAGIAPDRISLHGRLAGGEFRALQAECDIALDAHPCGGGATTCEVLWMGLPVITRSGSTPVSRAGASLLKTIGLPELIAHDGAQFMAIAARLAADPQRINRLRQGMRERMRASPLMQEKKFTRSLEHLYRQAWRRWCEDRR